MAYDESFANRVREVMKSYPTVREKKMFGGLGFMLSDHLAVAVSADGLIIRFDRAQQSSILAHPDVAPFSPTGRTMKGWALVRLEGCEDEEALADWLHQSCAYASSLPPKVT